MAFTGAGFHFDHLRNGGDYPNVQSFTFKDTETLTKGDLVNLETGEIDLAATADTNLIGAVLKTTAGTDSTTTVEVITDAEAVYRVYDTTARTVGATLDISGTTGAMTLAASSNADVIVVRNTADYTYVMIAEGNHYLD